MRRVYNPNAAQDVFTRARIIGTWQREPTDISGHGISRVKLGLIGDQWVASGLRFRNTSYESQSYHFQKLKQSINNILFY